MELREEGVVATEQAYPVFVALKETDSPCNTVKVKGLLVVAGLDWVLPEIETLAPEVLVPVMVYLFTQSTFTLVTLAPLIVPELLDAVHCWPVGCANTVTE